MQDALRSMQRVKSSPQNHAAHVPNTIHRSANAILDLLRRRKLGDGRIQQQNSELDATRRAGRPRREPAVNVFFLRRRLDPFDHRSERWCGKHPPRWVPSFDSTLFRRERRRGRFRRKPPGPSSGGGALGGSLRAAGLRQRTARLGLTLTTRQAPGTPRGVGPGRPRRRATWPSRIAP